MAADFQIGAITIYCEASSLSPGARRGVAWVIANRQRAGNFGKTISEVCLTSKQFSLWNDDRANNRNLLRAARLADSDPMLAECAEFLREAWQMSAIDPTGGATHFYDWKAMPKAASGLPGVPAWALPPAVQTAAIDTIFFFKGVK